MQSFETLNESWKLWGLSYLSSLLREKSESDLAEWAAANLKLPQSLRYPTFVPEEAPWLLEPLRRLAMPGTRRVDVRGPAGCAKSLIGEIFIAWIVSNQPGPLYYVWQTDDDAGDAMEERVTPMLDGNDFLMEKLPVDPRKKRIKTIAFRHMMLRAVGANRSAAQSKRIRYLIMEEPHLYESGMMLAFEKRCEGVKNPIILTLSTGSEVEDDSDKAFVDGTCEEWAVPCPHCGTFQMMTDHKDRLRSDRNDSTYDAANNIIWHKLLPTVRYNCEHCGRDWPKDQNFRREQAAGGKYIATNPNASEGHYSFHLEAPSVHWIDLEKIVEEKLKATYASRRGSLEPLREYVQKRRALAWDDMPEKEGDIDRRILEGFYIKKSKFDEEIARFMSLDNQAGKASKGEGAHRWFVCRAYGNGESRLIDEGRLTTWEECEEKRKELGVEPVRTLVDVAWDTQAVQAICVKYGWLGLWGDNTGKKGFPHHEQILDRATGKPKRITRWLPFSSVNIGHVGLGSDKQQRSARYFFWCNQPIRQLYQRLIGGLATYRWTHAQDTSGEYFEHRDSEFRKQTVDNAGKKVTLYVRNERKPDHLLDSDQMNLVAALMDPRIRPYLYSFLDEVEDVSESAGQNGS